MAQLQAPPQSPAPALSPTTSMTRQDVGKSKVEEGLAVYRELLELPNVKRATFLQDGTSLLLDTSHRSTTQLNKRSGSQSLSLDGTKVVSMSPMTFADSVSTCYAPDRRHAAVFRKNKEGPGCTIELWDTVSGAKLAEHNTKKDHEDVYHDSTFGGPAWSADGTNLVYAAEPKAPTSESDLPPRTKYEYTPDFGETFTGKRFPSLFLLSFPRSLFDSSADLIDAEPTLHRLTEPSTFPRISFGQAVFIPSESDTPRILATGYSSLPDSRKVGIVYCNNRPAAIYELVLEMVDDKWKATSAVRQSAEGRSARSTRVLLPPPGAKFGPLAVFVSNAEGGPHDSCASLHAVNLASGATTTLVDIVDGPTSASPFPGLFVDELPNDPFLLLGGIPHLVLTSSWRSRRVPLLISLMNGEVKSLSEWPTPSDDPVLPYLETSKREELRSVGVLTTDGGSRVVASRSGFSSPPEVVVMDLEAKDRKWVVLKTPRLSARVSKALKALDWTVLPLPKFESTEIVLISPCKIDPAAEATVSLPPLITFPHGGPHSVSTTDFSPGLASLAVASYRIALVNYPGSIGFGQSAIELLPPAVGQLEVDATLAASHYLNTLSLASRAKGSRFFSGGSHGGFIGAHLASKYPDEFDAFVMRNSVIDMTSNFYNADIPDWVLSESNIPYSFSSPPSSLSVEQFAHLRSLSPLTLAHAVKTPTLLLVGTDDRRVPKDQSRAWFHALKKNGTEVEMLVFPENGHGLSDKVETEILAFQEGLRFMMKYTVF